MDGLKRVSDYQMIRVKDIRASGYQKKIYYPDFLLSW